MSWGASTSVALIYVSTLAWFQVPKGDSSIPRLTVAPVRTTAMESSSFDLEPLTLYGSRPPIFGQIRRWFEALYLLPAQACLLRIFVSFVLRICDLLGAILHVLLVSG